MTEFVSEIKTIPYNEDRVYAMLSDLSNLERVKDRIPQDKIKDFEFDFHLFQLNPQEEWHGRIGCSKFDRFVRFAFYDLKGYFTYGIDSETARVAVELEVFDFILWNAVLHPFQVGKVTM